MKNYQAGCLKKEVTRFFYKKNESLLNNLWVIYTRYFRIILNEIPMHHDVYQDFQHRVTIYHLFYI